MKKLAIVGLCLIGFLASCGKTAGYKYVYKINYISPLTSTTITSFYEFTKGEDHHNTAWIRNDYVTNNYEQLYGQWKIDTLWVDSLGLIDWSVK